MNRIILALALCAWCFAAEAATYCLNSDGTLANSSLQPCIGVPGPAGPAGPTGAQGPAGPQGPAGGAISAVQTYSSGPEMVPQIVTNTTVNGGWTSIYSIQITNLNPQDVVILTGQYEATNDLGINVGLVSVLVRSTVGPNEWQTGAIVSPAAGGDFGSVSNDHHRAVYIPGIDTGANGTVYYNLLSSSQSTGTNGPIQIMQGYGNLRAVVLKH